MEPTFDLLITGGTLILPNKDGKLVQETLDLGIQGGKITSLGSIPQHKAQKVLQAQGLHVLPGLIDSQVHFREPGLEHKEDLSTGTAGAILGGITAIFDMPNTNPSTTSAIDFTDKVQRAKGRCWSHFAFYMGASPDNIENLPDLEKLDHCCGIKIFMGSSTGQLLLTEEDLISRILETTHRNIAVHCEDEERLKQRFSLVESQRGKVELHPHWRDEETAFLATQRLLRLARQHQRRVHVLHVTTQEEMEFLQKNKDIASVEVTPQHLTLSAPECYERLGTLAQMNPPVRVARHREALWKALNEGIVDVIGSDHAPHTREEKAREYPDSPSGMTGVQTTLPLMLNHVHQGHLTLERMVELLAENPARLFKMKNKGRIQIGNDADFTLVDLKAQKTISNNWIQSRSGWTPFDGMQVTGWPISTIIKGKIAMRDDQILGSPAGEGIEFD